MKEHLEGVVNKTINLDHTMFLQMMSLRDRFRHLLSPLF